MSVTHAAFFGTGAYATAILITKYNWNFFLTLIVSLAVSMGLSALFGLVLGKFKGDYYALISFGFNIIIFSLFLNWQELTRGPLGISGISRPEILSFSFSNNLHFLILVGCMSLIIFLVAEYVVNSSFGRVLMAIREDEQAISVFGYNTKVYKMIIFMISAGMAALAGSLFASYITFIDPSSFSLSESMFILAIVILGGLANNKGVFWGTVFLILLPEALRFVGFPTDIAAQMRQIVYGLLLLGLMMYRPEGLMGRYKL